MKKYQKVLVANLLTTISTTVCSILWYCGYVYRVAVEEYPQFSEIYEIIYRKKALATGLELGLIISALEWLVVFLAWFIHKKAKNLSKWLDQ